jgi:hypothetical protein
VNTWRTGIKYINISLEDKLINGGEGQITFGDVRAC